MTGAVKHAENAAKARQELAAVKAQASDVICSMVALIKCMYIFADFDHVNFDGRPVRDIVADLIAAESAAEMQRAFAPTPTPEPSDAER